MCELFILSKLLHRPMHGYLIQTLLNWAFRPNRRVSWGTLYPLIRRLEKSGYIVAIDAGADDPRGKRLYGTTEAGRLRFLDLLTYDAGLTDNSPVSFRIKLGCFGHLDDEARIQALMYYRGSLARVRSHSESMGERISNEPESIASEKRFALLALEHQKIVTQSEIDWVDSVLLKSVSRDLMYDRGACRPLSSIYLTVIS